MTGEMVLAAILTTVALGILIRGVVVLIWSAQQQYPAQALGVGNPSLVLFGGARISFWSAALVATTITVYGALFGLLGVLLKRPVIPGLQANLYISSGL
jgi:branched-chain amino acid transport system permease protein